MLEPDEIKRLLHGMVDQIGEWLVIGAQLNGYTTMRVTFRPKAPGLEPFTLVCGIEEAEPELDPDGPDPDVDPDLGDKEAAGHA